MNNVTVQRGRSNAGIVAHLHGAMWSIKRHFRRIPRLTLISFSIGLIIVLGVMAIAILAYFIAPYNPIALSNDILLSPNDTHWMGTDRLGRDLFSRIVYGARVSLAVAFIAATVSASIGVTLGLMSGYFGGRLDHILHITLDAMYAFPYFLMALIVAVALGPGIVNTGMAVAAAWIPLYYRTVRSLAFSIKERTFIEAEKAVGASHAYIIVRHILPYCSTSILVLMSLGLGRAIITTASLGFLGFGIPPPTPEWGADLNLGHLVMLTGSWWGVVFPGLAIFITVLGFNLFGESLDAVLNPRLTRRL